jgi:hypothetical protein
MNQTSRNFNIIRATESIDNLILIINSLIPQDGDKSDKQILAELCNIKSSTRYIETLIKGYV